MNYVSASVFIHYRFPVYNWKVFYQLVRRADPGKYVGTAVDELAAELGRNSFLFIKNNITVCSDVRMNHGKQDARVRGV